MTARELLDALVALSQQRDLSRLHVVVRLLDADETTMHMGGVAEVSVDSGCTDVDMLLLDCDQDPENCPLEEET